MEVKHLTEANFDATAYHGICLVDFWAEWCGPCKMLAPTIDGLAARYEGKATIAKVDVDTEQALAVRFNVMNIPTVLLFRDGELLERFVGVQPESVYTQAIENIIA